MLRRAVSATALLALPAFLAFACGGAPQTPRTPPTSKAPASAAPQTQRDRLAALLAAVDREGEVLDVPNPELAANLRSYGDGLTGDEATAITTPNGPAVTVRPITHLVLGGTSLAAYSQIALGDLLEMAIGTSERGIPPKALVEGARAMKRRAAAHVLRERAIDVASKRELSLDVVDEIEAMAAILSRNDIRIAACTLALDLDKSPKRQLALIDALAAQLDAPAARKALTALPAREREDEGFEPYLRRVEKFVEQAEAAAGPTETPEQALTAARAALGLGASARAREILAPHAAAAPKHLGLAAALARAKIESACPGIPGHAAPIICASAWNTSADVEQALGVLERAWASREGRDADGVETYVGLARVIPALYQKRENLPPTREAAMRDFARQMERLGQVADEAKDLGPRFASLRLLVDTITAAVEMLLSTDPANVPPPATVEGLRKRALDSAALAPNDVWTQAALMGVLGTFAQREDLLAPLVRLPREVDPALVVPRAQASLWGAVARGNVAAREFGKAELLRASANLDDLTRAKAVLLAAEADAAADSANYPVLLKIAQKLAEPVSPPELRLRAAIDAAGALARLNDRAKATETLESVLLAVAEHPAVVASPMLLVAKSYLVVLRARDAEGDERIDLRARFDALDQQHPGAASTVDLWRDLWRAELARLDADAACKGNMVCRRRVHAEYSRIRGKMDARTGTEAASVLRAGALGAGSVSMSVNYSVTTGLVPIASFEVQLLAVEVPGE